MSVDQAQMLREQAKWRSRRGLLELDIFFTRYKKRHLETLSVEELERLLALLKTDDIELWNWVSGRETCPVTEWQELIAAIRAA
ncbi:succinate dehydrogenase assembly factor 2 [Niveibacterium sp. SC-1]|uniref:FAD assembly factor SdhE n=1 Tax=Niveibacterium sp. SC-1 TaxID=3135646 RepID=UPI00311F7C88